jgi:anti-sigma-K factor RskA
MSADRAGEYVLGLLNPQERDAVERDAAADPALAREIAFWNARLEPLLDVAEVRPPPGLFERVQAAIAERARDLPGRAASGSDGRGRVPAAGDGGAGMTMRKN